MRERLSFERELQDLEVRELLVNRAKVDRGSVPTGTNPKDRVESQRQNAIIQGGKSSQPLVEMPLDCQDKFKGTSVAVVGGGLAGLMAARLLRQNGIKVTVFEARSQVGGRVRSNNTFSNGRVIEVGAELIGSFHKNWLDLAREFGLACISRMDESLYEREGLDVKLTLDRKLEMDEICELDKNMEAVLEKIAEEACNAKIRDPSRPWLQSNLQIYDSMSVAEALEKKYGVKRNGRLWKSLEHLLVNDEVAPLEKMNFLGLLCKVRAGQDVLFCDDVKDPKNECLPKERLMKYWNELEIFRCADGCQELAKRMARELRGKYRTEIKTLTAVTSIALSENGVKIGSKRVTKEEKGELARSSLPPFKCDYVILAIPPTVWDRVTITAKDKDVRPPPQDRMVMGPAVKFFSNMKGRFWIKEKAAPYGGSLAIGQVWEGTDNQTLIPDSKQGIVLSVFAGPITPTGGAGRRAPNEGEFNTGLSQLYSGYKGNRVGKPLLGDWPNEPFIKTGYASPKTDQIFTVGKMLSQPFPSTPAARTAGYDRLFFAGEHTHMAFFGYMEGALRSGERAANTLMLKKCGLYKDPEPEPSGPLLAGVGPTRTKTTVRS